MRCKVTTNYWSKFHSFSISTSTPTQHTTLHCCTLLSCHFFAFPFLVFRYTFFHSFHSIVIHCAIIQTNRKTSQHDVSHSLHCVIAIKIQFTYSPSLVRCRLDKRTILFESGQSKIWIEIKSSLNNERPSHRTNVFLEGFQWKVQIYLKNKRICHCRHWTMSRGKWKLTRFIKFIIFHHLHFHCCCCCCWWIKHCFCFKDILEREFFLTNDEGWKWKKWWKKSSEIFLRVSQTAQTFLWRMTLNIYEFNWNVLLGNIGITITRISLCGTTSIENFLRFLMTTTLLIGQKTSLTHKIHKISPSTKLFYEFSIFSEYFDELKDSSLFMTATFGIGILICQFVTCVNDRLIYQQHRKHKKHTKLMECERKI